LRKKTVMIRFIDTYLDNWVNKKNRKPLVLRGARQVGKTYSVQQLAKRNFEHFINLNFERHPDLISIFESNDPGLIMAELSSYFSIPVIAGKTLVFFDEIQSAPAALKVLRYFYEEMPRLHIIAAGSLLDHILNKINYPMPVGRVEFAYMYPLTFYEFLLANGEKGLLNYLEQYNIDSKMSEALHKKALAQLRLYYFIGGMPEAVKVYADDKDLSLVEQVQENILTSLKYDFGKYGTHKEQQALNDVLNYVSHNTGKKVKYSQINRYENQKILKSALLKLEMSRIVHLVRKTKSARPPINQMVDNDVFKPVFMDIGLANRLNGIRLIDIDDLVTAYEGSLAEQFTGQELIATLNPPYIDTKLYYWHREAKNSNAEIDYLLQIDNSVVPVEVKAGKTGRLKSLQVFLAQYGYKLGVRFNAALPDYGRNLKAGVKLGNEIKNIIYDLLSLPLYFTGKISGILKQIQ